MGTYTIPCRCCGLSAGPTCANCGIREWILTVTGTVSNPLGEAILGVFSLRVSYESAFAECADDPCYFLSPVMMIEGERFMWAMGLTSGGINALVLKPWPPDYEYWECMPDGICRCNDYSTGLVGTTSTLNCAGMSGTTWGFVGLYFGFVDLAFSVVPA